MENRQSPETPRVRFLYTQAPDYRLVPANGACGGPTPRGEFLIEFFCERPQMPMSEDHPLDAEGRLGPASRVPSEQGGPQLERYVQVGVVMMPQHAVDLAHWILGHLQRPGSGEPQAG